MSSISAPYCLRQCDRLAGQQLPRATLSLPPRAGLQILATAVSFLCRCWQSEARSVCLHSKRVKHSATSDPRNAFLSLVRFDFLLVIRILSDTKDDLA